MKIISLELVLQRPATDSELYDLEILLEAFAAMPVDERLARKIHKVTDLAAPGSALADAVHYREKHVLINERFVHRAGPHGAFDTEDPYAGAVLRRLTAAMLEKYARPHHVSFYVIAGMRDEYERKTIFRTVVPRTLLEHRDVRHRDARKGRR